MDRELYERPYKGVTILSNPWAIGVGQKDRVRATIAHCSLILITLSFEILLILGSMTSNF